MKYLQPSVLRSLTNDQILVTTTFDEVRVQTAVVYSPQFGLGVPEVSVVGPRNQVLLIIALTIQRGVCLLISAALASRLAGRVLKAKRSANIVR
jgi:hypothetical protein